MSFVPKTENIKWQEVFNRVKLKKNADPARELIYYPRFSFTSQCKSKLSLNLSDLENAAL